MHERGEYIGGFCVEELLGYLRELERHGFGEVTVIAHEGRFLVREEKAHRPHEQARLTE